MREDDGRTDDGWVPEDAITVSSHSKPHGSDELNQRINGPVNANLISGPSIT